MAQWLPPVNIPQIGAQSYAAELQAGFAGIGNAIDQNRAEDRAARLDALAADQWDKGYARELAADDLARQRFGLEEEKFAAEQAAAGPYSGTSMDAQNWNRLLTGDPSSPEYAAAYGQLTEPKMHMATDENGMQYLVPYKTPLPATVRPPTYGGNVVPTTEGPMPGGTTMPAQSPAPGTVPAAGPSGTPGIRIPLGEKPPTEEEIKGDVLLANVQGDYDNLVGPDGLFDAMNSPGEILAGYGGDVGRLMQSPEYQRAYNAAFNIVQSYIYAVSGAQAPDTEVARNVRLVIPNIGDKAETIADKRRRLEGMMEAIRTKARQNLGGGQPQGQPEGGVITTPSGAQFRPVGP